MSVIPGDGPACIEALQAGRLDRKRIVFGMTRCRLLRLGLLGLIVALFSSLSAPSARACYCGDDFEGPDLFVAGAGVIFRGTPLPKETAGIVKIHVNEVLKGTLGDTVNISNEEWEHGDCGASFTGGTSDVIVAQGDRERGYGTGACWQWSLGHQGIFAAIDRYRKKLAALDEAVAASPADPQALFAKARFLGETNARLEALAPLERLLQVAPLHRDGILFKADLLYSLSRDDEAVATLEPLLAANPDDDEALSRRSAFLRRPKSGSAVGNLDRLAAMSHADLAGRPFDMALFRGDLGIAYPWVAAGSDLPGADLSEAKVDANFSAANLTGAILRNAIITGKFKGAHLQGADLRKASLRGDLTGASLRDADLRGASFKDATLTDADLTGARYDEATVWPAGFDPAAAGAVKE